MVEHAVGRRMLDLFDIDHYCELASAVR